MMHRMFSDLNIDITRMTSGFVAAYFTAFKVIQNSIFLFLRRLYIFVPWLKTIEVSGNRFQRRDIVEIRNYNHGLFSREVLKQFRDKFFLNFTFMFQATADKNYPIINE